MTFIDDIATTIKEHAPNVVSVSVLTPTEGHNSGILVAADDGPYVLIVSRLHRD